MRKKTSINVDNETTMKRSIAILLFFLISAFSVNSDILKLKSLYDKSVVLLPNENRGILKIIYETIKNMPSRLGFWNIVSGVMSVKKLNTVSNVLKDMISKKYTTKEIQEKIENLLYHIIAGAGVDKGAEILLKR